MKGFVIAVAILATLSAIDANTFGLGEKFECFRRADARQSRIYENEIRKAIEDFREKMKTVGFPEFGIPPVDPLDVEDQRIQMNNDVVNMDLNLTAHSEGLAGFEIVKIKMSLIGLKFQIDLRFPEVTLNGKYNVLADTPLASVHIFGNGDIDAKFTGFTIGASGKVKTKLTGSGMKILLDYLEADVNLEKVDFKITGLLDSDEFSEMISGAITAGLPQAIKDRHDDINKLLKVAVDKINEYLLNSRAATMVNLNELC